MHTLMHAILAVVVIPLSFALGADRQWEHLLPPETNRGPVTSLALYETDILAVTTQGDGILHSPDLGLHWTLLKSGLPATATISSVAFCGKKMFSAASDDDIFRYDDSIGIWIAVNAGLPRSSTPELATTSTIVFAGTDSGLYKSADYGKTWDLISSRDRRMFAVSGNIIIREIGYVGNGFLRSIDCGLHWDTLKTLNDAAPASSSDSYLSDIAVSDTAIFVRICCSTGNNIYFSGDTGRTWKRCFCTVQNITANNHRAVALSDGHLFEVNDSATAWYSVDTGLPANTIANTCALSGKNILIGTQGGRIYLYDDDHPEWKDISTTNKKPGSIISLAANETSVFTATNTSQLFRSTNCGVTWENTAVAMPGLNYTVCNGNVVFSGNSSNLYRSASNGDEWTEVFNRQILMSFFQMKPSATVAIKDIRVGGEGLFLRVKGQFYCMPSGLPCEVQSRVLRSGDNGENWAVSTYFTSETSAKTGTDVFFASIGGVIRYSADSTSDTINTGLPDTTAVSLFNCNDELFACLPERGIFHLDFSENTWIEANSGLTGKNISCMLGKGAAIFAGTNNGVFYSSNNGAGWIALISGLEDNSSISSLAADNRYLYALIDSSVSRLPLADFTSGTTLKNLPIGNESVTVSRTGSNLCVKFSLPRPERVSIAIFNLKGRKEVLICTRLFNAGSHRVTADSRVLTSGCHLLKIKAGRRAYLEKVNLLR